MICLPRACRGRIAMRFTATAPPCVVRSSLALKGLATAGKGLFYTGFPRSVTDCYAMLMSPSKGKTAAHGCYCPRDMAVCIREVMARPWVGVCVPLALINWQFVIHLPRWEMYLCNSCIVKHVCLPISSHNTYLVA